MHRQHVYSLLLALFLTCTVAFSQGLFRLSSHQLAELGDGTDRTARFYAILPLSQQQTTVARPTLDPTRMPLTTLPIATIRAELTATTQQATALAQTPTATLPPTPTQGQVAMTAVPSPNQVPVAGQASHSPDGLILLSLAIFCVIVGVAFIFFSSTYQDV